jgi:hypothetical protein
MWRKLPTKHQHANIFHVMGKKQCARQQGQCNCYHVHNCNISPSKKLYTGPRPLV